MSIGNDYDPTDPLNHNGDGVLRAGNPTVDAIMAGAEVVSGVQRPDGTFDMQATYPDGTIYEISEPPKAPRKPWYRRLFSRKDK